MQYFCPSLILTIHYALHYAIQIALVYNNPAVNWDLPDKVKDLVANPGTPNLAQAYCLMCKC